MLCSTTETGVPGVSATTRLRADLSGLAALHEEGADSGVIVAVVQLQFREVLQSCQETGRVIYCAVPTLITFCIRASVVAVQSGVAVRQRHSCDEIPVNPFAGALAGQP